ncbi:FabD/lysophospholipase-like protein [Ceratobasidium sp. AG-I]|nr:FabD/lysophospholipase-like protein [Ceratobasidium sp. AG-I]KAF8602163.1 FabD/lysophospholipase-like protein [Ceratobasidium sp. AG-I]
MPSNILDGGGVRALSLDGGYVNVLSALIVLRELLSRKQRLYNLPKLPLPADSFDIMAGTGMGGVMLILMGRLKLTIDLTIIYCVEISEKVFGNKKWLSRDSVFSATALERLIGKIVARHCGRADARMIDSEGQSDGCKVMVCARTADAIRAGTTCIRTYRVSANQGPECTIVEAVRATTAAPGMFKRAHIKEQGVTVSYVGGGLGCNNPTDKLLVDIATVFPERPIACVVSIGCGQVHSGDVPDATIYDAFLPSKLLPVMQSIAMDCDETHQDLARRFEHAKDAYFRFNTEHGMQGIDQSDATMLSKVQAHAQAYLHDVLATTCMDSAARAVTLRKGLVEFRNGNIVLLTRPASRQADSSGEQIRTSGQTTEVHADTRSFATSPNPRYSRIGCCPSSSQAFTGREDILEQMQDYFFGASPVDRRLFVLCGLGGAGKTQLALKFVQTHRHKFWDVFYIDATTRETISTGLAALAKTANVGETLEEALVWLISQEERWLLVLNNADDRKLNLREFFPACIHGDILITTRNQQIRMHTQGPRSYCSVGGMLPQDALALMLKASGAREEEHETEIANTLVKDLGYFALAIVQSGAYMRATQCGLAEYQGLLKSVRERLLAERGTEQMDDYGMSLYASWEISRRQLTPRATQLLRMMSFMHHEGISEAFFKTASDNAVSYIPHIPLNKTQMATMGTLFDFLFSLRTPSGDIRKTTNLKKEPDVTPARSGAFRSLFNRRFTLSRAQKKVRSLQMEWDPLALKDLTNELRAFSLLDYDPHLCSYSMHPLVQEWCRTGTPHVSTMRECAAWVLALCVNWKFDSNNQTLRRLLLPHVLALGLDHVFDFCLVLSCVYVPLSILSFLGFS